MSNVAKFLIILNLLLAGVFVGSAANFLGQKDYVQDRLQTQLDTVKAEKSARESDLKTANDTIKTVSSENSALRDRVTKAETEASNKAKEAEVAQAGNVSMGAALNQATTALATQNATIDSLQQSNKALQEERTKLMQSRDNEHTARTAAEASAESLRRQLDDETAARKSAEAAVADGNRKIQELDAEVQAYRSKYGNEGTVQPAMPPGHVLAVDNQMGIVVTSLGEEDGVKKGFEYLVSRGNKYVATIKITDVQAKKSTGMVVKGMQQMPIQLNDAVLSR